MEEPGAHHVWSSNLRVQRQCIGIAVGRIWRAGYTVVPLKPLASTSAFNLSKFLEFRVPGS